MKILNESYLDDQSDDLNNESLENYNATPDPDDFDEEDEAFEDDADDSLIPVETDDSLEADDDLDPELDENDKEDDSDGVVDTLGSIPSFSERSHGRSTGTMVDHEPGLPGPINGDI